MKLTKKELSWALYDVGNSAFYTTVMAGFFPVFFKQFWHPSTDPTVSTFHLGLTNSLAALAVAIMAPLIGSIADLAGIKRPFLIFFSILGIASALLFPFVGKGEYQVAMWLFGLGMVGASTAASIYDSQLTDVTSKKNYHKLSALGYSLGYLGGGLLFALNVAMTLKPTFFGLNDATEAVQLSFLTVGVWWALFSLPIILNVKDSQESQNIKIPEAVKNGFLQIKQTVLSILGKKQLLLFLLAYWFYIDGVGTVMRMAVDYGMSLGFESSDLITALLLVQFLGFPAALLFGRLGDKYGAKLGIYLGIFAYATVTIYAYFMTSKIDFFIIAALVGLVQGGIQSLSRSMYANLIPQNRSAEFFGFYNMLGKFAAIIGPVLMGGVGHITGSTRLSILSILVLFIIGGTLLSRVKVDN